MFLAILPPALLVKESIPQRKNVSHSLIRQIAQSCRQSLTGYRYVTEDLHFMGLFLHWFFSWSAWYIVLPTLTSYIPEVVFEANPGGKELVDH
eukprot:scaffold582_cov385-Prasinococcus_capsulatus_cf.AAC.33